MSELSVKNASINVIQVQFNDETAPVAVNPGRTRVTSVIGEFKVFKAKVMKYSGVFSGIDNCQVIVEETNVDTKFTVKNDNANNDVVVTHGAKVVRIPPGGPQSFTDPGKYTMSFPEKNEKDGSETLRAILTVTFQEDNVDNSTLHIS